MDPFQLLAPALGAEIGKPPPDAPTAGRAVDFTLDLDQPTVVLAPGPKDLSAVLRAPCSPVQAETRFAAASRGGEVPPLAGTLFSTEARSGLGPRAVPGPGSAFPAPPAPTPDIDLVEPGIADDAPALATEDGIDPPESLWPVRPDAGSGPPLPPADQTIRFAAPAVPPFAAPPAAAPAVPPPTDPATAPNDPSEAVRRGPPDTAPAWGWRSLALAPAPRATPSKVPPPQGAGTAAKGGEAGSAESAGRVEARAPRVTTAGLVQGVGADPAAPQPLRATAAEETAGPPRPDVEPKAARAQTAPPMTGLVAPLASSGAGPALPSVPVPSDLGQSQHLPAQAGPPDRGQDNPRRAQPVEAPLPRPANPSSAPASPPVAQPADVLPAAAHAVAPVSAPPGAPSLDAFDAARTAPPAADPETTAASWRRPPADPASVAPPARPAPVPAQTPASGVPTVAAPLDDGPGRDAPASAAGVLPSASRGPAHPEAALPGAVSKPAASLEKSGPAASESSPARLLDAAGAALPDMVGRDAEAHAPRHAEPAPPAHRFETARAIAQQLVPHVREMGGGTVEVQLAPEELGKVRMSLSHADGTIAVTVSVERPETLDLLRRHADLLVKDFREQGFASISFSFGQDGRAPRQEAPQRFATETSAREPSALAAISSPPRAVRADGLDIRF